MSRAIKILTALFIFCLWLTPQNTSAALERCPYKGPPKITVNFQTIPIEHDYTKGSAELTALSKESKAKPNSEDEHNLIRLEYTDGFVSGLHVSTFNKRALVDTKKIIEENRTCLHMRDVTINYTLKPKIYITKEANYRNRKKCFDTLMKHEMQHNINAKKAMLRHKEKFEKEIGAYILQLSQLNTVKVGAGDKAKRNFKDAIRTKSSALFKPMYQDLIPLTMNFMLLMQEKTVQAAKKF